MKKRLLSTAAIAVALGLASFQSHASTVTLKGSTQATLYGFAYAEFAWDNQMTNIPDLSNMPKTDPNSLSKYSTPLYKSTYDETEASAESFMTRLGLKFTNSDANLKGKLEGDFKGGSGSSKGNFRMRQAWVEHKLGSFNVLIGQAYILEEMHSSISMGDDAPGGFNIPFHRVPVVELSLSIDLGSADLDLALAFEWSNSKAATSGKDTKNTVLSVDRYVFPTTAARAVLHFDTGFGAPAKFYAWGSVIPVYVSNKAYKNIDPKDNTTAYYYFDENTGTAKLNDEYKNLDIKAGQLVSDKSETSYAFGVGVKVPVSMVTIGSNFQYSDGATDYAGLTDYEPASYYLNSSGDVEKTQMYAWNINATVSPTSYITVGAEYDYAKFDNDVLPSDPKVETVVGNVKIKTTKVTSLGIEWRHVKAKNFDVVGAGDNDFSGDQVYAVYKYKF